MCKEEEHPDPQPPNGGFKTKSFEKSANYFSRKTRNTKNTQPQMGALRPSLLKNQPTIFLEKHEILKTPNPKWGL